MKPNSYINICITKKCYLSLVKNIKQNIYILPYPYNIMNKTRTSPKVYTWKCKICDKIIVSLYESQFEQNKQQHEAVCKKK